MIPIGERCLVDEIIPVDEDAVRAAKAGLVLVSYESQAPKPTSGVVVAIGNGPLIQESVQIGDTVFFSRHAGSYSTYEGKNYRNLEVNEITTVLRGVSDPPRESPPNPPV